MSNWRDEAECRDRPDLDMYFFAEDGQTGHLEKALAHCALCPVREECLENANLFGADFGVWGGKTARQRRDDRARRLLRRVS